MTKKSPLPAGLLEDKKKTHDMPHIDYVLLKINDKIPTSLDPEKIYVLTTGGVAKMLGVCLRQVQILCEAGKIRYSRMGSFHRRFLLTDIQDYLIKNKEVHECAELRNGILVLGAETEDMDNLKLVISQLRETKTVNDTSKSRAMVRLAQTQMDVTVVDARVSAFFVFDWVSVLLEMAQEPCILQNIGKLFILSPVMTDSQKELIAMVRRAGGQATILKNEGHDPNAVVNVLKVNYKGQFRVAD